MPELPEVEHLRRRLVPRIVEARVDGVDVHRDDILARGASASGRRGVGDLRAALQGRRIIGLGRHGKLLMMAMDDGAWFLVHLGMSGQLLLADDSGTLPRPDHVHLALHLRTRDRSDVRLAFRDPRRFGGVLLVAPGASLPRPWAEYGPDALTGGAPALRAPGDEFRHIPLSADLWSSRFQRCTTSLKVALLDQRRIAGIGNIYADEILHRCRVHPRRVAGRVTLVTWQAIAVAAHAILTAAIEAGGSSIRDYVDPDDRRGEATRLHAVYGRSGHSCHRCGRRLRSETIGGRTSVFCTRCQPNPRTIHRR